MDIATQRMLDGTIHYFGLCPNCGAMFKALSYQECHKTIESHIEGNSDCSSAFEQWCATLPEVEEIQKIYAQNK